MSSSFQMTQWSVVLAARGRDAPQAREALTALCSPDELSHSGSRFV
jgi:hypothetical protein